MSVASHRVRWLATLLIAAVSVVPGCATGAVQRRATTVNLPAFIQVDEGLYRGGQPSPEGIRHLAQQGIKTVICLRQPSQAMEAERRLVESLGMRWVNLPMWFWWRPSDQQIHQFLQVVTDPASRPVFVHCRQGQNRVGVMTAIYRVTQQHWSPSQAYAEGRRLGMVSWNLLTRWLLFRETPREFVVAHAQQPIM